MDVPGLFLLLQIHLDLDLFSHTISLTIAKCTAWTLSYLNIFEKNFWHMCELGVTPNMLCVCVRVCVEYKSEEVWRADVYHGNNSLVESDFGLIAEETLCLTCKFVRQLRCTWTKTDIRPTVVVCSCIGDFHRIHFNPNVGVCHAACSQVWSVLSRTSEWNIMEPLHTALWMMLK